MERREYNHKLHPPACRVVSTPAVCLIPNRTYSRPPFRDMDSTAACFGRGRRGEQIPAASPPPPQGTLSANHKLPLVASVQKARGERGGVVSMASRCRVINISKAASLPTAARSSEPLTESSKRSRKRHASDSPEAPSLPAAYDARVG